MPNFERNLRQTATYWHQTSTNQYGAGTFAAPVAVLCRWEDIQELFIDKRGQEMTSKARVFLAGDTPVDIDGYLFLGTSVAASPVGVQDAYEIRQKKRVPDLQNLKALVSVIL